MTSNHEQMKAPTLNNRIADCLRALPGAEDIDVLLAEQKASEERSDFLVEDRTGIIELKSLEADLSAQVEKVIAPLRERDDAPLIYGKVQADAFIRHFPDADEIRRNLFLRITKSYEQAIRKANRQILGTKKIFDIENAWGAVLFCNQSVDILSPEIMGQRADMVLRQKRDGIPKYANIHSAILISEAHYTFIEGNKSFPIIQMDFRDGKKVEKARVFFEKFVRAWSAVNRAPLYKPDPTAQDHIEDLFRQFYHSVREDHETTRAPLTNNEKWRSDYRANRYLSSLDDAAFAEVMAQAMEKVVPFFLNHGPTMDRDMMYANGERMTHLFEEASLRGFDMKKLRGLKIESTIKGQHKPQARGK